MLGRSNRSAAAWSSMPSRKVRAAPIVDTDMLGDGVRTKSVSDATYLQGPVYR